MDLDFIEELESTSGIWYGCTLNLTASRIIGDFICHYDLATQSLPNDMPRMSAAAHLLLILLSFKVIYKSEDIDSKGIFELNISLIREN